MSDALPPIEAVLGQVLQDFAEEVPPDQIVADRFGEARPLRDEDQAAFYAFVWEAGLAFPEAAEFVADAASDLADHLVVSLTPDRAARIECALALYAAAAEVYPSDEAPADRAHLGARVAIALTHRLRGDRAENLADAVATAEHAVDLSNSVGPAWINAEASAALGSALLELPGRAMDAYRAFLTSAERYLDVPDRAGWAEATLDAVVALTEAERPGDPDEWADLLASAADRCADVMAHAPELPPRLHAFAALAAAKVAIARGGAGPLEMAVGLLEDTLDAPPDDLHLADEAKLHVNLGVAYGARLHGDPEENLERAIQAFATARDLFHPLIPFDAALTDLNLAAAYGERIRGDTDDNVNLASGAARRARTAFQDLGDEELVRKASLTLGSLLARSPPSSATFLEGVGLLSHIARSSAPPLDRALAQTALASALAAQGGDPTALLREAADTFEALGASEQWGHTLCDLADALPPPEAAALYAQVLDRLPLDAHVSLRLRAARSLFALGVSDDPLAISRKAVRAALRLAALAPDDPYRAHLLAENAWPILADHVALCSRAGAVDEAHQTVLHVHGLILMAGLGSKTARHASPPTGAIRHEALRRSLTEGDRLRDELRPARGRLSAPQPQAPSRLAVQWQTSGDYVASVSLLPLEPEGGEAVLTTFIGPAGLWTGLSTPGAPLRGQWHGPDAAAALEELAATIAAPAARHSWTWDRWSRRLDEALARFAEGIGLAELVASCPPSCHSLVVRPYRAFHVVPFAALPVAGQALLDRFPGGVTLLPLPLATVGPLPPPLRAPLAVAPAPGAPPFAGLELELGGVPAETIPVSRLIDEAGRASLLHIAAHAAPNPSDPLAARLDFGPEPLRSPYDLELSNCALVTLAACDSAWVNLQVVGTNVVGLQASFLLAGARHVLAALWPVDDAATTVLLGRFYHEIRTGSPVPTALSSAQAWVRSATPSTLRD